VIDQRKELYSHSEERWCFHDTADFLSVRKLDPYSSSLDAPLECPSWKKDYQPKTVTSGNQPRRCWQGHVQRFTRDMFFAAVGPKVFRVERRDYRVCIAGRLDVPETRLAAVTGQHAIWATQTKARIQRSRTSSRARTAPQKPHR
jgi:hypothetical protein